MFQQQKLNKEQSLWYENWFSWDFDGTENVPGPEHTARTKYASSDESFDMFKGHDSV